MIMKLTGKKSIKPLQDYVFVEIYSENPYREIKSETGLITSTSEVYENGDGQGGNKVELDKMIGYGIVVETGDECRILKVDDEVYFDVRGGLPVPIGNAKIIRLNERNTMAYIRDAD